MRSGHSLQADFPTILSLSASPRSPLLISFNPCIYYKVNHKRLGPGFRKQHPLTIISICFDPRLQSSPQTNKTLVVLTLQTESTVRAIMHAPPRMITMP